VSETVSKTPGKWPAHSPERRQFSVLCWRGWCDSEFRDQDIGVMVSHVTGKPLSHQVKLPPKACPSPDTCECECHDKDRVIEPVPLEELAEINPGLDQRGLRRLQAFEQLPAEDDAASGYQDPEE
jgi:hypothetical protein